MVSKRVLAESKRKGKKKRGYRALDEKGWGEFVNEFNVERGFVKLP